MAEPHVPTTREVREEYAEFDYATSYWLKRGHDVGERQAAFDAWLKGVVTRAYVRGVHDDLTGNWSYDETAENYAIPADLWDGTFDIRLEGEEHL